MQANELRIGNWLNGPEGNAQVTGIQNREVVEIGEIGHVMEDVSPIPLTEEWLIKFGFEWHEYGRCYNFEGFSIIKSKQGFVMLNTGNDIGLEYVHSLQNLYFALTGKELTIK